MQVRSKKFVIKGSAVFAAAVASVGFARAAHAQFTTYTAAASGGAQIEPGEAYEDGGGDYWQIVGAGATYPTFGILDFSTTSLGVPQGQQVSSVGSTLNLNLTFDSYSKNTTSNQTLTFYIATDTNPAEDAYDSTTGGVSYVTTANGGVDGVAPIGATGGFAAGSSLYEIGTGIYNPATAANAPLDYAFTLNSTEQSYIQSQINTQGTVRIVATTGETDTGEANFYGYANTTAPYNAYNPSLGFQLTTTVGTSNGSKLYVGTIGTKTASVTVGKYLTDHGTGQYCILQGATSTLQIAPNGVSSTSSVTLLNGSNATGDSLIYTLTNTNGSGSTTSPGPDPIAPGGTAQAVIGFGSADSALEAGSDLSGQVQIHNASNYSTDTTPVTVNINAALVLQERHVDSYGASSNNPTLASNVGKVLVGATGSVGTTITTDNPVQGDYGNDVLTTLTLNANQTATPYVYDDYFTKAAVATIGATGPATATTFDSTESGNVMATVKVAISGEYGNDTPVTEGTVTSNNTPTYAAFPQSAITGDGLEGESDSMDVYMQWTGYQAAAVTSGPGTTLGIGGTATLSNAVSNDNIYTDSSNVVHNNGLRANAWVTGVAFNQSGWGQSSLIASTGTGASTVPGTILNSDGSTTSTTITFNSANKLNGTYGATMTVNLENDQTIQGTTTNDVAPVTYSLQTTVTSNPSVESGTYSLNGGTLSAPATNLTGSFTQTGGSSVFAGITGSGAVAVTGGTLQLGASTGATTVASLAVSGIGVLDISNNHVFIDYGSGTDPIASVAAMLAAGYNGGAWNGVGGIDTSAPLVVGGLTYGLGYADGADPQHVATGLASGVIEIKYTLLGDADLNGIVNGIDFGILAANFNKGITGWDEGDFDYNNIVNGLDFGDLAANFNKGAAGTAATEALDAFAAANGLLADVPEPGSIGLLAVGATALAARRRRKQ